MGLHVKVAVEIYATYAKGVMAVTNLGDQEALFGTDDEDNPFADLEKLDREIWVLLLKIFLTSVAEDIPQFAYNVLHYQIKQSESTVPECTNGTSPTEVADGGWTTEVPTTATHTATPTATPAAAQHELLYLLKSTFMASPHVHLFFSAKLTNTHLLYVGGFYRFKADGALLQEVAEEEAGEEDRADQARSAHRASFAQPSLGERTTANEPQEERVAIPDS